VEPENFGLLDEVAVYYADYGVDLLAGEAITATK
jgi:hypothetical protein